ncbi:MAG: hypothetical protein ACTSPI_01390 [Candidatus Heimdallarchaeaceae archaeon]
MKQKEFDNFIEKLKGEFNNWFQEDNDGLMPHKLWNEIDKLAKEFREKLK